MGQESSVGSNPVSKEYPGTTAEVIRELLVNPYSFKCLTEVMQQNPDFKKATLKGIMKAFDLNSADWDLDNESTETILINLKAVLERKLKAMEGGLKPISTIIDKSLREVNFESDSALPQMLMGPGNAIVKNYKWMLEFVNNYANSLANGDEEQRNDSNPMETGPKRKRSK